MPQTSITEPAIGYAGQIRRLGNADSAAAEGPIVAGQPVLRGTDPAGQAIAIADGDTVDAATLLGWAILETSRAYNADGAIQDQDPVTAMRRGRMLVQCESAAVAGNPVFVGTATAQLGLINGAAGTGFAACPGARFSGSIGAAGLVEIEISLA